MIAQRTIMSYTEMCAEERVSLQRGMNFRLGGRRSVLLMSVRRGAPYVDRIEEDGRVLIYEGHDASKTVGAPEPKRIDQPMRNPGGSLTQNGLFWQAAQKFKDGKSASEIVKVYEKIKTGIWVYDGDFQLTAAWLEPDRFRKVFKFRLELLEDAPSIPHDASRDIQHNRLIPTGVKLHVWKRDKGKCVLCGSSDNLHFDHDIPYSKGGSSLVAANIRLLCARHNLAKRDRIE